jgi:hypothetical protein
VFDRRIARSHDTNGDGTVDVWEFYAYDGEDVLPAFSGCRRDWPGRLLAGAAVFSGAACAARRRQFFRRRRARGTRGAVR